jgi:hypothetical protein
LLRFTCPDQSFSIGGRGPAQEFPDDVNCTS